MHDTTPNVPRKVSRRRAIVAVVAAASVATIGPTIAKAATTPATSTRSPFLAPVTPTGHRKTPALLSLDPAADPVGAWEDHVSLLLERRFTTYEDALAIIAEGLWQRTGDAKHLARIVDAQLVYRADPTLDNFHAMESATIDAEDARARQAVIAGFRLGHSFGREIWPEATRQLVAEALTLTPDDFR